MNKNDSISRRAALDALNEQIKLCDKALSSFDISMRDAFAVKVERASLVAFGKMLKDMPSAQRWIPCSKRLPKVREWVLCQCRAGIMDVLRLTGDGNWNKNYPHAEYMSGFVIAWMPLPKPWEGEENG